MNVEQVRFPANNGQMMSGTLYVPADASAKSPAPGVVAIHGYINSKEYMSQFGTELAKRGFVVLLVDETGHGYSDPPAFAAGFGGPPALRYIHTIPYVDDQNVGLVGHSMGGWASVYAAGAYPEKYDSMVLLGSSTGTYGAPKGTPTFPKNLAVVYSEYDEFSKLMWGVPVASKVSQSNALQRTFGTNQPVQEGKIYGSVEKGTARKLYTPATTHPATTHWPSAMSATIEWLQLTLEGEDPMPPSQQTWYWGSLGTLLSLVGAVLFLFPFGTLVVRDRRFEALQRSMPDGVGFSGLARYGVAALAILIPLVTYFPLQDMGGRLVKASTWFPQAETNGIMFWAVANAVIILALFAVWHYTSNRDDPSVGLEEYGVDPDLRSIGIAALAAVTVTGGLDLLVAGLQYVFDAEPRFWMFAIKLLSPTLFRVFLSYVLPFTFFFVALGLLLHVQHRPPNDDRSLRRAMGENLVVVTAPYVLIALIQYVPLLTKHQLPLGHPLRTIMALNFIVLLGIAALVSTFFFRRTNRIWTGAFVNGILVTWIIVGGMATHAAL